MMGSYEVDMSIEEARRYLEQFPDGTLGNGQFPLNSFVARDENGATLFYDGVEDRIHRWDWDISPFQFFGFEDGSDHILRGWWYLPGHEMAYTAGGLPWWARIRKGEETPA